VINHHYSDENVTVYHGDCLDVLAELPDASVDSVVTDPPYGLNFMGKHWDTGAVAFDTAVWGHCLRVLKPGGHVLAFGGTRTWHRLACAIEDAGFEIRDCIAWLYGSGFPKSLDVSKAIDKVNGDGGRLLKFVEWMRTTGVTAKQMNKAAGTVDMAGHYLRRDQPAIPTPELWTKIRPLVPVEVPAWVDELVERIEAQREITGRVDATKLAVAPGQDNDRGATVLEITAPATDEAKRWQGWGTALKPAFEPIVVGRKPLSGTVAGNVLAHGVGALNIDGCRVGDEVLPAQHSGQAKLGTFERDNMVTPERTGRWPSNVVIDPDTAEGIDQQSGNVKGQVGMKKTNGGHRFIEGDTESIQKFDYGTTDDGGASRFFPTFRYQAKATTNEKPTANGVAHPTVKPLDLMRWLVRLVTPPGGLVLEPFAGSGTTAEACIHEHLRCIAIEREADYLPLIVARLSKPMEIGFDFGVAQ
jgi:site-specific DNA-methyltransferase (adenine-specific)